VALSIAFYFLPAFLETSFLQLSRDLTALVHGMK
jgi:hypothetical protein